MNLENEKVPSPVNAPESYFKESESRLLQRLGIDKNNWVGENDTMASAPVVDQNLVEGISTKPIVVEAPKMELNPVTQLESPLTSKKQEPTTITSSPVRKEIDEVGQIHIDPLLVSTNETPEWVNFAALDEKEETTSTDQDLGEITKIKHVTVEAEVEESIAQENQVEAPAWEEIVVENQTITGIDATQNNEVAEEITVHHVPEFVDDEEALKAEYEAMQQANQSKEPAAEPLKMETQVNSGGVFSSNVGRIEAHENKKPVESKLYNQHAPGVDTLEPPPAPFAPIAGLQEKPSSPNWIGAAASIAAIVAAYFIWTAIQPSTDVTVAQDSVVQEEPVVAAQTPTTKDTVAPGIRLVEGYILEKKLEKYQEPKIFSIDQKSELSAKSVKALNDLEQHNIAVFDMEDNMFEELDLEI